MFPQLKLENHRNHIALFCIALCCTALFWIVLICIAAFILLATTEKSAAQTPDQEFPKYLEKSEPTMTSGLTGPKCADVAMSPSSQPVFSLTTKPVIKTSGTMGELATIVKA